MYGIGLVARLAQVSVRTLRHYDDVGLLKPSHVDPITGYRHYTPEQVLRLHRILVLRDLGVPLAQIGRLIDDDVTVEQLRGILRLRQAEARARLAAQTEQLRRVEIRLAQLEEKSVADYDVIVKRLEPVRVVVLSEDLEGHDQIGPALDRMYPRLHAALAHQGVRFDGLSLALYEDIDAADRPLRVTAALQVQAGVTIAGDGVTTVELGAVERAATTVVRGDPSRFAGGFRALHEWVDQTGAQATAFERELYIDCDGPRDTWVTELQVLMAHAPVAGQPGGSHD